MKILKLYRGDGEAVARIQVIRGRSVVWEAQVIGRIILEPQEVELPWGRVRILIANDSVIKIEGRHCIA